MQDRDVDAFRVQQFRHGTARAAHHRVVLEGDQAVMAARQFQNEIAIQRLDEAHVGAAEPEVGRHGVGRRHDGAEGEQGDAGAAAAQLRLAHRQGVERRPHRHARPATARIAHGRGAGVEEAGAEHLPALVLVGGRHHQHVRDAAQVAEIEAARVRGAIGADHAAAVDREQHVQVLQRHVVDELVVGALQEARIDGHDRLGPFAGHAGGQRDRMLLGDGGVEIARRVLLREPHQAGALAHRRRDAQQALIGRSHVAEPVAEHLRVGRLGRAVLLDDADQRIEGRHSVVLDLVAFGAFVTLALGRDHVQQLRALEPLQHLQCLDHRRNVVSVDRAAVVEAHFLEQRGRHQHALPVFLPAADEARGRVVALVAEQFLAAFAHRVHRLAAHHAAEHLGQSADVLGDRHPVVVEDHQQVRFRVHATGMVERLEGHTGGHRAIADHRDHAARVALGLQRDGHAQRGGDRGGRMADAKGVVIAFLAARERRHAATALHRVDGVAAAGEDLVRIALVADVPDQAIHRRVVEVVQGDGQLDHAQARTEMAADLAHRLDQVGAQLVRDRRQLGLREFPEVGGEGDPRQARVALDVHHPLRRRAAGPAGRRRDRGRAAQRRRLRRRSRR